MDDPARRGFIDERYYGLSAPLARIALPRPRRTGVRAAGGLARAACAHTGRLSVVPGAIQGRAPVSRMPGRRDLLGPESIPPLPGLHARSGPVRALSRLRPAAAGIRSRAGGVRLCAARRSADPVFQGPPPFCICAHAVRNAGAHGKGRGAGAARAYNPGSGAGEPRFDQDARLQSGRGNRPISCPAAALGVSARFAAARTRRRQAGAPDARPTRAQRAAPVYVSRTGGARIDRRGRRCADHRQHAECHRARVQGRRGGVGGRPGAGAHPISGAVIIGW